MTAGEGADTGGTRLAVALAGATLLLAGGAVHAWLAFDGYGSSALVAVFFLNGVVSGLVAAWLVWTRGPLAAIAGLLVSVGSLLGFLLSRTGAGVLGFRGTGLSPAPEAALTLITEVSAMFVLAALVFMDRRQLRDQVNRVLPG